MGLVMIVFRLLDAGLAPWVMVAMFLLAAQYIAMRNLSSADTVKVMAKLFTRTGFAWFGWVVALVEVPVFAWTIRKENHRHRQRERAIGEDANKAREMLKAHKQEELKLK